MLLLLVTNTPAVQHTSYSKLGKAVSSTSHQSLTLTQVQSVCAFLLSQAGTFGEVRAAICEELLWSEPQSLLLSVQGHSQENLVNQIKL